MKEAFEKIIDRLEEVKSEREAVAEFTLDVFPDGQVSGLNKAIEIVNQVAEEYKSLTIEPKSLTMDDKKFNDGWIPCSERLPEERDWYLAVFQEPDTGFIGLPYIADYLLGQHTNYTTNEGWIIKDCTDNEDACEYYKDLLCVAWQPLPAPYKPKGE